MPRCLLYLALVGFDVRLNIGGSGPEGMSTTLNGEFCIVMGIDQLDKLRDFGCLGGSENSTWV